MTDATVNAVSADSITELQNLYITLCGLTSKLPIPDGEKRDAMVSFRAGFLLVKEMILLYLAQQQPKLSAVGDVASAVETAASSDPAAPAA